MVFRHWLRSAIFLLPYGLSFGAFGCDGAEPEPGTQLDARTLVGAVEQTDIALGVLLDGDELAIYQCGGEKSFATDTRWYRGMIGESGESGESDGDPDAFELRTDDARLVGTRTAEGLEGELVQADGGRHAFVLEPVADDALPGVYLAQSGGLVTGVIVREQGGELTAQGASCDAERVCSQVIILPPLSITSGTLAVRVAYGTTWLDAEVTRTLIAPGA